MSDSLLGTAIAFVRRRCPVLPLHFPLRQDGKLVCSCRRKRGDGCTSPAKHPYAPLVPRGLLDATTDVDKVKRWFASGLNLGIRTGAGDALLVLDIDPRHDGDRSLAELERAHGPLPQTWRSITGSGGEHIFFDAAGLGDLKHGKADAIGLGPGVDVPHYVVGPPSIHICGRPYAWSVDHHPADHQLAPAPAWLIEKLTQPKTNGGLQPPDPAEIARKRAGKIVEYRDMAVASVAGSLLRAVSIDPAFAITLVHDWNACHCDPPLPEREVTAIFNRIADREIRRLRSSDA
jgi:hypothetical protein